jgi:hypothetical protein
MKRFIRVSTLALLTVLGASTVVAQPAAVIQSGCGVVIMQDGELFAAPSGPTACGEAQGPWTSIGNLFALAAHAPGQVAGATTFAHVIAANGDWFQLGVCGASSRQHLRTVRREPSGW